MLFLKLFHIILQKFQSPARREHTDQLIRRAVRSVLETLSVQRGLTPALAAKQDFSLTLRTLSVVRTISSKRSLL